jgi:hypothetical protein
MRSWPRRLSLTPCRLRARSLRQKSAREPASELGLGPDLPPALEPGERDLRVKLNSPGARLAEAEALHYGRTEQRLFDEVVTDYERARMFERG